MAGRKTKSKDPHANRREYFWAKALNATTPRDRLAPAVDYLKKALSDREGLQAADDAATKAARELFKIADELWEVKP